MITKILLAIVAPLLLSSSSDALDRIRIAVSNPNMPNLNGGRGSEERAF